MSRADPAHISPTAHYTSYVWYRHGLSHPALVTPTGRLLYHLLRPANLYYEHLTRRANLDMMLLARHQLIDAMLSRLIESGEVSQVIEIAAGFSPRGQRFAARYAQRGLVYVEGDLPQQAASKRAALEAAGLTRANHHVVALDALSDDGPDSLSELTARLLSPERGVVLITEGLLGYFDEATVRAMWARFARCLQGFPVGVYLSELTIRADIAGMSGASAFVRVLGAFTRGRVHIHFGDPDAVRAALQASGFAEVEVLRPHEHADQLDFPGKDRPQLLRVLRASAHPNRTALPQV